MARILDLQILRGSQKLSVAVPQTLRREPPHIGHYSQNSSCSVLISNISLELRVCSLTDPGSSTRDRGVDVYGSNKSMHADEDEDMEDMEAVVAAAPDSSAQDQPRADWFMRSSGR